MPLSFDLHSQLAETHDGVRQWGYRRINCGKLVAKDQKASTPENVSLWNHIASWTPLGKRKYQKEKEKGLQGDDLPDDLDWFTDGSIESYEDISTKSDTAQVNPYQFTMAMAKLAEEAGVNIVIGSVDAIEYTQDETHAPGERENLFTNGTPDLRTGNMTRIKKVQSVRYTNKATSLSHTIPASVVVLAAGPWTPVLFPSAPIASLRVHSVTIRPTRPVSAYCIFTEVPIAPGDDEHDAAAQDWSATPKIASPEIYSRPNNEVYVCGSGDNVVPLPVNTDAVEVSKQDCQNIVDVVSGISNVLREGVVTSRRACYLPTVDIGGSGGPLIGETGIPGLILATGHSCWGIHNAPATGKLVSEIIFDGESISADIKGLDPRLVV